LKEFVDREEARIFGSRNLWVEDGTAEFIDASGY
jgi:hypothetical protein